MTWETARARVYNDRWDTHIPVDHVVYEYLRSRHLEETWEARSFGILASDQPLHSAVRHWPREGYRLIAPVFDQTAKLVNVQGRAILARTPKTLFPKGSRAWGTMFASREALELLRGSWTGPKCVVLGEGMTDFLAFAILCSVPVICSPGTGVAARSVGAWAKDCAILLALDADQAGENAIAPIARQAFEFGAKRVRRLVWPRRCKDACDALVAVGAVGLADFLDEQAQGVVL